MNALYPREKRWLTTHGVARFMEVRRTDDTHEIVISHQLKRDANGVGQIVLSPGYARHSGRVLIEHATEAEAAAAEPNVGLSVDPVAPKAMNSKGKQHEEIRY